MLGASIIDLLLSRLRTYFPHFYCHDRVRPPNFSFVGPRHRLLGLGLESKLAPVYVSNTLDTPVIKPASIRYRAASAISLGLPARFVG
jgi:hypothetical protein